MSTESLPKTLGERWKDVLRIAWPLIIANSFWNIQLTIDRVFLGHYSTDSLGAAMAVMGVFWVPMALLQQTAAYSITFTSQYFGSKQMKKIGPSFWQSLHVSWIGGLLFLLLIPASPMIFKFIGHSERMMPLEIEYFSALSFSALPTALVAAMSGFYTGLNQSRMVMWMNCVGLIANVILDYLFIFGNFGMPEMGIIGAGYATAGANFFAAAFGAAFVFSEKNERQFGTQSGWALNGALLKRFVKYGLPSGLQWSLEGLAFTVFLIFIGQMPNGDAALAATGVAVTVMLMAVLPAIGVGQAISARVGQFLGENNTERAEQVTWTGVQIAITYIATLATTFLLFPEFYTAWFGNTDDPEKWLRVAEIAPTLLMFVAVFTCFDSLNFILSFSLKGAGDTRFVSIVALTVPWPIMVIPTGLTAHWEGAVYWAWGFASLFIITQALVFFFRFRQGKWKNMRVIENEVLTPELGTI